MVNEAKTDPATARIADGDFARALMPFVAHYPDLLAAIEGECGSARLEFRRPSLDVPVPRFGLWIDALGRQGLWPELLRKQLSGLAGVQVVCEPADRLRVTVEVEARSIVDPVVDRLGITLEWLAHRRSDCLFWPWTGRHGPPPTAVVEPDDDDQPVTSNAGTSGVIFLTSPSSVGALARRDDALLIYGAEDAQKVGAALIQLMGPVSCRVRPAHVGNRIVVIEEIVVPGSGTGDEAAQLRHLLDAAANGTGRRIAAQLTAIEAGSPVDNLLSAFPNHDGLVAADWLGEQLIRQLANWAELSVNAFISYASDDVSTMSRSPERIIVMRVLPGIQIDPTKLPADTILIDLFGLVAPEFAGMMHARNILLVSGADLRFAGDLPRPPLAPGGPLAPALAEALLLECSEADGLNCSRWRDAAQFDQAAARHRMTVAVWHGVSGPIDRTDWHAFERRRSVSKRDREGVETTAARPSIADVALDEPGLAQHIFSRSHLRSQSSIIDPCSGERISYAALYRLASAHAARLQSLQVPRGAVVAVAGSSGLLGTSLFLACLLGGWPFAPLDSSASSANFAAMLDALQPGLILFDAIAEDSHRAAMLNWRHLSCERFVDIAERPFQPAALTCQATAAILFTSGSTGRPKAVPHRHHDFLLCSRNYGSNVLRLEQNDTLFSPSRLFFAYGLNNMTMALLAGASVVLAGPLPDGSGVVNVIAEHGVTAFMAVPVIYKIALGQPRPALDRLRLCVSAGERLPAKLCRAAERFFGVPVLDGVGSTEALSTFISNRSGCSRAGAAGTVVPGFEIRLINQAGDLCEVGEPGSLWLKGATIAQHYLTAKGVEPLCNEDGWLDTGDILFCDAWGRFHHLGRRGNVIKVNACWLSAERLEGALQSHDAVEECAVCIVTDEHGLRRPKALVVIKSGHAYASKPILLWTELRNHSKKILGKDQYPHIFESIQYLPRSNSGKLLRSALLELQATEKGTSE